MTKEKNNQKSLVAAEPALNWITYVVYLLLLLSSAKFAVAQSGHVPSPPPNNAYDFNPRFNPSMAIIIIVLITSFFFMGFFSIYIRQCAEREGRSVRPGIAGIGRSRQNQRGLDPSVIDTFPIFEYSEVKGLKIGKNALECAVCLSEFEDDETLRLLPKCDHVFHPECIDTWLVSHITCPVCRANLVPESGDSSAADVQIPAPDEESNEENRGSEIDNSQNHVSIRISEDPNRDLQVPDVINLNQIPVQTRPPRSKSSRSRFTGKFPRSHSTGHSLVRPGENCDRFTLRLPEDVRKQILSRKLNRTTSCVVFPTEGSTRRGYRSSGEGSSRGKPYQFGRLDGATKSDRWVFSMTPPFFTRTSSVRSQWKSTAGDGESTATPTPKAFLTSVKTPFDCLGAKTDATEESESSNRVLV